MLLVLAAPGMSFVDIARLRRGDITVEGGAFAATTRTGERFRLTLDSGAKEHPGLTIYRRWAQIQAFLDEYPGTHLLRHPLTDPVELIDDPLTEDQARQPLMCPIDR